MLVKVADVRAKVTDVKPKMAVVLTEAISSKEKSGRYKNPEMPDYTGSSKVGRTERSGPIVFYCVKNEFSKCQV